MNERKYKVYIYTNKTNGKKYVGQTCRTLKVRAGKNGIRYQNSICFYRAIQKYGWDNFDGQIMYDNLTKNEANDIEIQLIQDLNTCDKNYGYNIALGGYTGNPDLKMPVVQFDLEFNYIKRYDSMCDAEIITGLSKSHIREACNHKYRQAGGFIWLFEEDYISGNYNKEHILYLLNKEFEHPNARPVVQCDLDMNFIARYKNICEASRKSNTRRGSINDNCIGKLKTAGGYIWMYEEKYEENKKNAEMISFNAKNTNCTRHSVVQLDLLGNFIAEFSSLLKASKATGVDRKSITYVCKGKYKQAGGFVWCYASDYYAKQTA